MKKVQNHGLLKRMIAALTLLLITQTLTGQTDDFEYLSSPDYKGEVVRIEERAYYRKDKGASFKLSDTQVFNYSAGKIMDAYQEINISGDHRTFRKYTYNEQGLLQTVEVTTKANDATNQQLSFFYDDAGNIIKVQKERGRYTSYVTYEYDDKSKLIRKSRTNERGTTFQLESLSYDTEGRLSAWESNDQVMRSKATKVYSYSEKDNQYTTTIELVKFNGAKDTEISTKNALGLEINMRARGYNAVKHYAMDDKKNWIRMDMQSNYRSNYTLRQITYADGTTTGYVEPKPEDGN